MLLLFSYLSRQLEILNLTANQDFYYRNPVTITAARTVLYTLKILMVYYTKNLCKIQEKYFFKEIFCSNNFGMLGVCKILLYKCRIFYGMKNLDISRIMVQ